MRIILAILLVLILGSCKTIFTAKMKIKLESNNVELSTIQYYNSSKIRMERTLLDSESDVEEGKIEIKNGKRIQVIRLPKNTPGILVSSLSDTLHLAFEDGDNKTLPFVYNQRHDDFRIRTKYILYEGKKFVAYYFGGIPKVKVKKKALFKTIKESRKMKGLKVSNHL